MHIGTQLQSLARTIERSLGHTRSLSCALLSVLSLSRARSLDSDTHSVRHLIDRRTRRGLCVCATSFLTFSSMKAEPWRAASPCFQWKRGYCFDAVMSWNDGRGCVAQICFPVSLHFPQTYVLLPHKNEFHSKYVKFCEIPR